MCFVYYYDWRASIFERTRFPAEKETLCDECRRPIPVGSVVHHVYAQEADECVACEHGDCSCQGDCCQCAEPSVGETFDYDCCNECHLFLAAVETAELEAGCSLCQARPPLSMMTESLNNGDRDEAKKYWKLAAKMYPELVKSGYLGWLWRKIF